MQNCWRAIFKVFGKFQECKVQMHNCWRCFTYQYGESIYLSEAFQHAGLDFAVQK